MVKWLEEITVAPEESQNFYHFHDNRVLPPGVDQEKAKAEGAPPSSAAPGHSSTRALRPCPNQVLLKSVSPSNTACSMSTSAEIQCFGSRALSCQHNLCNARSCQHNRCSAC